MSKHWKFLVAIGLGFALTATACGGRDEGGDGSDDTTDTTDGSGEGGDEGGSEAAFIDPEIDCDTYEGTKGVEGDTIKIGTIRPADGPYAIYDQVTTGMQAFVDYTNTQGGVVAGDGKTYKLELIKENDGYDPSRTPPLAKKLVEQDGVFALLGVIGTENNKAIREYLNEECVPNIALATGSPEWGRSEEYPWYFSGLPSYAAEANAWVTYLKDAKPDAKIALLYQDDDFGKSYQAGLTKAIEAANADGANLEIVAEQSYNPLSGSTTEAATVQLSQSGADVFIVGIGGTPCPQTLGFVPQTWDPLTFISVTCGGKTAMSIAGPASEGVVQAQATYDPSDPADIALPQVAEFIEAGLAAGLTQQQVEGGIVAVGWGFGALFAKAIEESATVDRADVMNTLYSLEDQGFGLVREEITVNTNGSEDPWAIEGFRISQRNAEGGWTELSPVTNFEGKSNGFAE
jgi:branched-chain amino acid transport system substrate-binding protein